MPVDTARPVFKHLIMIFGIEAPLAALEQKLHPGAPFRQWLLNCRWCFDAMNVEAREVRAFSPLETPNSAMAATKSGRDRTFFFRSWLVAPEGYERDRLDHQLTTEDGMFTERLG